MSIIITKVTTLEELNLLETSRNLTPGNLPSNDEGVLDRLERYNYVYIYMYSVPSGDWAFSLDYYPSEGILYPLNVLLSPDDYPEYFI